MGDSRFAAYQDSLRLDFIDLLMAEEDGEFAVRSVSGRQDTG